MAGQGVGAAPDKRAPRTVDDAGHGPWIEAPSVDLRNDRPIPRNNPMRCGPGGNDPFNALVVPGSVMNPDQQLSCPQPGASVPLTHARTLAMTALDAGGVRRALVALFLTLGRGRARRRLRSRRHRPRDPGPRSLSDGLSRRRPLPHGRRVGRSPRPRRPPSSDGLAPGSRVAYRAGRPHRRLRRDRLALLFRALPGAAPTEAALPRPRPSGTRRRSGRRASRKPTRWPARDGSRRPSTRCS
jgi:hypothetical protein